MRRIQAREEKAQDLEFKLKEKALKARHRNASDVNKRLGRKLIQSSRPANIKKKKRIRK